MRFKIYDISMTLSNELLTWPGDPRIRIRKFKEIMNGDKVNLSELLFSTHHGTHVDAPSHFFRKGMGVDSFKLKDLILPCYVKEVRSGEVGTDDIRSIDLKKYKAVIFRTANSRKRLLFKKKFFPGFTALGLGAARELVRHKIRVCGIDYLSIEKYQGSGDVHRTLLKNNVIILEGLDLTRTEQGAYTLLFLPLKIQKGDGAPSRALLLKPNLFS
ncbi:MAG: cyclase family protein [bacterium]|nr:cyclase family protein [bacterium]